MIFSKRVDNLFEFLANSLENKYLLIIDKNRKISFLNDILIKKYGKIDINDIKILSKKGIKEPFFEYILKNFEEDSFFNASIYIKDNIFSSKIKYKRFNNSYVFIIKDLSLEEKCIKEIEKRAYKDSVTNLPNRELFFEKLNSTYLKNRLIDKSFILFFLEIENYQNILNFLGDKNSKKILKIVSKILKKYLKDSFIARVSEQKFAIIIEDIKDIKNLKDIFIPIINLLNNPINLNNHEIFLNIFIGASIFPYYAKDKEELLKYANFALLEAKREKTSIVIFSESLKDKIEKIEYIRNQLPNAIKNREFEIFFQPKLNLYKNKIESAEVLIRWKKDNHFISPAVFIPIAEETGDILKIGEFVLESAFKFLYERKKDGKKLPKLSINISPIQMKNQKIVKIFDNLIDIYKIDPYFIELEITESAILDNENQIINILNEFKKIGLIISLDDFGTGYSSLYTLTKYPIDKIKIDKSLIDNYKDKKSLILLKNIFALAYQLRLKTVIEGIEYKEQLDIVKKFGCFEAQGYFISKPLNKKDFEKII